MRARHAALVGLIVGCVAVVYLKAATTYYVDPAGSGSTCSFASPCTLTTAVGQVNSATIVGDDTIHLNSGKYGQAALTISGSGTAGHPIIWEFDDGVAGNANDAYLSGCREAIPTGDWSLVAAQTYTYQAAFDIAAHGYTPTTILQCSGTTFAPITVRESAVSINAHEFTFPPSYSNSYTTTAELEAQGGSFRYSSSFIYAHTYDDLAPAAHHDLWVRSSGWGALSITGDYHTFLGLRMEYANNGGIGLSLTTTSSNIIFRYMLMQSASTVNRGDDNQFYDGTMESVSGQAAPTFPACYDWHAAVAGFYGAGTSTGFCWNWTSDGSALSTGANGADRMIIQRMNIVRNWNNFSSDGSADTQILDSDLSQTNNHALIVDATSTGLIVTGNIIDNAQESFYTNATTGKLTTATISNNLFTRGALLENTTSTGITFTKNIVSLLRTSDLGTPFTSIDCNLYMPSVAGTTTTIFTRDLTPTDAAYTSVAEIQAATTFEDNGANLPYTSWFDQFVSYDAPPWVIGFVPNFHPVNSLAQALTMPGCGRVGPLDLDVSALVTIGGGSKGRMRGRMR